MRPMNKLQPYNKYKASGIEWLGDIPEHWEVRKLKYSLDINNGADYKHIQTETGYPVIGSGGQFAFASEFMFDGEVVFLGRKGTIDKPLYFNGKFWAVDTMFYANGKGGNNVRFHFYVSTQIPFKLYSTSTALPSMTQSDLKGHYLAYPSILEQTAIAAFLDYKTAKIDRFIRKKKQLIKLLNEQKAGIINDAVTGKINCQLSEAGFTRLKDKQDLKTQQDSKKSRKSLNPQNPNSDRRMKSSGIEWLGDIPEHWEVRKLKYVAECFPSNIDKHSREEEIQVRLCNYIDVYKNDYITNDMSLMLATATEEQISRFTLQKGDVIITKDSETANDIAIPALVIEDLENVVCGYHLSVLRPDKSLLGAYLFRVLQVKTINIQFEICSNGVTRVGLGVYDLKKARIPIPTIPEQQQIVSHIEIETAKLNRTIATIEKEIALVQEYKTALIAEAVTGKIDVREYCLNQDVSGFEDEQDFEENNDEIVEINDGENNEE